MISRHATLSFQAPAQAIVRQVSTSYNRCIRQDARPINVARARVQHAAYVCALKEAGVRVRVLPEQPSMPDACFVEDPALVLGRRALITRSAASSRQPEAKTLRTALIDWCDLSTMPAPGTLDGGDVLRIDNRLFVGRSARSNDEGIAWLRFAAAAEGLDVIEVPLSDGLHLKSAATLAAPDLLVYHPDMIDATAFTGVERLAVEEPHGANVLALGDTVLVSADAPRTAEHLAARRLRVRVLQVDEFHRGDGALTCLSLRLPRAGTWVA
ncbi:MAG: arginine deiminase-related protein [Myxococcota bacterium]